MDTIGRQDAWRTVGGCPVVITDVGGPTYRVEVGGWLRAWVIGNPTSTLEHLVRLVGVYAATAQQVTVIDHSEPACGEGIADVNI